MGFVITLKEIKKKMCEIRQNLWLNILFWVRF